MLIVSNNVHAALLNRMPLPLHPHLGYCFHGWLLSPLLGLLLLSTCTCRSQTQRLNWSFISNVFYKWYFKSRLVENRNIITSMKWLMKYRKCSISQKVWKCVSLYNSREKVMEGFWLALSCLVCRVHRLCASHWFLEELAGRRVRQLCLDRTCSQSINWCGSI